MLLLDVVGLIVVRSEVVGAWRLVIKDQTGLPQCFWLAVRDFV